MRAALAERTACCREKILARSIGKMTAFGSFLRTFVILQIFFFFPLKSEEDSPKEVYGWVNSGVELPCIIDINSCGSLHSIKWYRGSSRIYIFSGRGNYSNPEGEYSSRATLVYEANTNISTLYLNKLTVSDEAVYKCEITYLDFRDNCHVVQFIHLTTLITPTSMNVTQENGELVVNGSYLGPINEDSLLILTCSVSEGKPVPSVTWYNGSSEIKGSYEPKPGANGIGIGRSVLQIKVSRNDLYSNYECRAASRAMSEPMSVKFKINVNVKPLSMQLRGLEEPIRENELAKLICSVLGGKPKPTVQWYNNSQLIEDRQKINDRTNENGDGTVDYIEELTFTTNRFDNERNFACRSTNDVRSKAQLPPLEQNITVKVHYPPIVNVTSEFRTDIVEVNRTRDVLLNCSYEANPAPSNNNAAWYFNGKEIFPEENSSYNLTETTMLIANTSGVHIGNYTCSITNTIARSKSANSVFLNVFYPPQVVVNVLPSHTVKEESHINATLRCTVNSGNPSNLSTVLWFLNEKKLNLSSNCSDIGIICHWNPAELNDLILINVNRSFHGNYSCQGTNLAGTGQRSPDREFIVFYPPGKAELYYQVQQRNKTRRIGVPIKGDAVTLTCQVREFGRPSNVSYLWYRGESLLANITTSEYKIETVNVKVKTNFSCQAVNEGGKGRMAVKYIQVYAPPEFQDAPPPYASATIFNKTANLSCIVECYPTCDVYWQKNENNISGELYKIENKVIKEDPNRDDFEAVHSTLIWNINARPDQQLDPDEETANYTCVSSSNQAGDGVRSKTIFEVFYPPKLVKVSEEEVNVTEGNVPPKLTCTAKSVPDANIHWRNESEPDVIREGRILDIRDAMSRHQSGYFICNASNNLGSNITRVKFNVLYKPLCTITEEKLIDGMTLKCNAKANPANINYTWTTPGNETENTFKHIHLKEDVGIQQIYNCTVRNEVGESTCSMIIPPSNRWWLIILKYDIKILLAFIVGLILLVTIVCVIIIVVCSRRRKAHKSVSKPRCNDYDSTTPINPLNQPESDKAFYENLPFHGMQTPPNKPFRPEFTDLDYADVDYRSYGPINYKAASMYAAERRRNQPPEDYLL